MILRGFLPACINKAESHLLVLLAFFGPTSMTFFEDGQPTSVKMDLQFQELKILTQESYQEITAQPLIRSYQCAYYFPLEDVQNQHLIIQRHCL